jgi:hypothetical protein
MPKNLKRYNILIIFIFVTILGLFIRYITHANSWLWELWSVLDVSFAVALGVLAFEGYREFIKSEDEVPIYFRVKGELTSTGLSLLRKDCTRGEILGVLGMMQRSTTKRFSFDTRELPLLLQEVQTVQKGDKDIFEIEMTPEEFEQFDLQGVE